MVVGIIGGTPLLDAGFMGEVKREVMENKYGGVFILKGDGFIFIPRHGEGREIPPHRINHRANIFALEDAGVVGVVAVNSVGGLREEITPGSLIVPDDYISLWDASTYFDNESVHVTPGLDENLRETIIESAVGLGIKVITRGTYFQSRGPRLETKAEIRFMGDYADVVGMTMASEATLAREIGLGYASICAVNNYAHGVVDEELDFEEVINGAVEGGHDLKALLKGVVRKIGCY